MRKCFCCVMSAILIMVVSFSVLAASDVDQGTYGGYHYEARISRAATNVWASFEYETTARLSFDGTLDCVTSFGVHEDQPFAALSSPGVVYFYQYRSIAEIYGDNAANWSFSGFVCHYKVNQHLVTSLTV